MEGSCADGTPGIPDYDEDLDEAFAGPEVLHDEDNVFYDDEYEEESQALIEATVEGTNPLLMGQQIVSDHIQFKAPPHASAAEPRLKRRVFTCCIRII